MNIPHDINTERCIISGMTRNGEAFFNATSELTPECFYSENHQEVFKKLSKEIKPDVFTLSKICEKINDDIFMDISEAYGTVDGKKEIQIIKDLFSRREIIKLSQNAINAASVDFDYKAADISTQLFSRLIEVQTLKSNAMVRMSDIAAMQIGKYNRIANGGTAAFIKTGIPKIDEKLIITQHDYIVLGGRPSNGKSTIAGMISRNVAKSGGRVLCFFLDSAKDVEVDRALFTESGCDLHGFNSGLAIKNVVKRLEKGFSVLSDLEYYIDDSNVTAEQIVAKAHQLKAQKGELSLIVIDYLTRVRCNVGKTLREQVNHTSSVLHSLPKLIGCPVLVLSQLSRYDNEETVPPSRRHLKESGNIEQDADALILVHWPGNYATFSEENTKCKPNEYHFYVSKQKNGPTGRIKLYIDKSTQRIFENNNYHDDSENTHSEGVPDGWKDRYQ